MKLKGFVIYAPGYCRNCAGVYSLYKIAQDLKDHGFVTMISIWNSNSVFPNIFDIPIVPNIVAMSFLKTNEFVVIYPEVISGNPLNAKYVIRWALDVPGKQGGSKSYDDSEMVFAYSDYIKSQIIENEVLGVVELPTIDTDLFFNDGKPKTDISIYTGKKEYVPGYVESYDNIITRTSPQRDEVAKILRKTKILYTFDPFTIVIHEALLCGANVVIVNNDTKLDFKDHELGNIGIQNLNENLHLQDPDAISTSVMNHLNDLKSRYLEQLANMISIVEEKMQ